jgi:hypothetical protein
MNLYQINQTIKRYWGTDIKYTGRVTYSDLSLYNMCLILIDQEIMQLDLKESNNYLSI